MDTIFRVSIVTDNDAFGTTHEDLADELASILASLRQQLLNDPSRLDDDSFTLRDANGNRVGHAELTRE